MIIGIDIDDTITETSLNARKYLENYDPNCLDHHNLSLESYDEFMRLHIDDIMRTNNLKEGVKEAFDYLNNNGYKIVIITARNNKYSDNVINITEEYLKSNNLKYDKIIFDKEKKGAVAREENIKLFIDDKEYVLDDMKLHGIDCIRITNDKNSKHRCIAKWKDIVEFIKSWEG